MGSLTTMFWPLDGSRGPSPFHGHSHWFACEVAISNTPPTPKVYEANVDTSIYVESSNRWILALEA